MNFKKLCVIGVSAVLVAVAALIPSAKVASKACYNTYEVTLYKGNDNADGFITSTAKIRHMTAYSIIKELKAIGAVASNVKANSLDYVGKNLVLDLSKEFVEDVNNGGTSGEYIKVGCIVNTFIDAFKVDTLTITVDGKSWESGHTIYDSPLEKYVYQIPLYCSNENADGFEIINADINELTADSIIELLKTTGIISEDVKVNSFENNGANLVLDLSNDFEKDMNSVGVSGEYVKMGCLVNTFLDAFQAEKITITVNGQNIETGHMIYDQPLTKYN